VTYWPTLAWFHVDRLPSHAPTSFFHWVFLHRQPLWHELKPVFPPVTGFTWPGLHLDRLLRE